MGLGRRFSRYYCSNLVCGSLLCSITFGPNGRQVHALSLSSSASLLFPPISIEPSHAIFRAPNPTTGRPILLTALEEGKNKNSGGGGSSATKWQELLQSGGWMVYRRNIVRVFGGDDSVVSDEQTSPSSSSSSLDKQDMEWFLLQPTIEPVQMTDEIQKMPPLPHMDDLLWIAKPDGLLTLPGKSEPDSLATRVNAHLSLHPKEMNDDPTWIPRPCHRLDQDTSGIVVMAKTRAAYTALSKQFEDRLVTKQYVALVHGHVQPPSGKIDAPIGQKLTSLGYKVWTTDVDAEKPREAKTLYQVSKHYSPSESSPKECTRILLQPKTGRGHQLRLHMKLLGHSIVGDALHGSSVDDKKCPRLCLHAEYLEIWVTNSQNQICRAKAWCLPPF